MGFSEPLKKEVRQKAGYRCCWCQQVGDIEVHHIVPEKEDGSDDMDNAAALCGRCHNTLGDNPSLRKQIRERRDWLYERVAKMYPDHPDPNLEKLSKLVGSIHEKQERQDEFSEQIQAEMGEVKVILGQYVKTMEQAIDRLTPETVRTGTTSILNASSCVSAPWANFSGIGEEATTRVTRLTSARDTVDPFSQIGEEDSWAVIDVTGGRFKEWPDSSDGEEM